MNTYLRILSHARPFSVYLPQYILYTILYVAFSLVNLSILIPVLEVLFNQVDAEKLSNAGALPEFTVSVDYLKSVFNHYFEIIIRDFGRRGALQYVCGVIIVSVFLANLFRYLSAILLAKFRIRVVTNLRNSIYQKLNSFHIGYFTEKRKGDIVSRVTTDILEVESSVVSTLKVLFKEPALIIGYFSILFSMSVELTLYTMLLLPISGGLISYLAKKLKKRATKSQESLGRINSIIDETLTGMRIIKAFTASTFMIDKFDKEVKNYGKQNMSIATKFELAGPISEFLGIFAVAGLLMIGGSMVLNNESTLSASEFIAFIIIFSQILNPAKAMSNAFSNIQRGLASAERVFSVIDTPVAINDAPNARVIKTLHDSISIEQVSFRYDTDDVIKNISLTIPKGSTLALVGASGGGKSTLADLIPRFYDPSKGSIRIDGIDIREYQIESLRKLMGIVTQESILFNDSVYNNIAFGSPEVSMERVIEAAKVANAHEFITALSDGYETNIGDRGLKLSGGQRQRMSIARAVLKNPPILILDEATSALDSESELLVQEALTNLMQNRTSIVIAHRLSTIQNADQIVVIQQGEVIEHGSHQELMKVGGVYHKLTQMQSF